MSESVNLYIIRKSGDINGKLASLEGRILIIVDNYTVVHAEMPELPTDGVSHIYEVEVPEEDLAVVNESGKDVWYIWRGEKGSRARAIDKAQVPVRSLAWSPAKG